MAVCKHIMPLLPLVFGHILLNKGLEMYIELWKMFKESIKTFYGPTNNTYKLMNKGAKILGDLDKDILQKMSNLTHFKTDEEAKKSIAESFEYTQKELVFGCWHTIHHTIIPELYGRNSSRKNKMANCQIYDMSDIVKLRLSLKSYKLIKVI